MALPLERHLVRNFVPSNSKALVNRLTEIMEENKTTCLEDICNSWKVQAIMWMLNQQVFGQLAIIDMPELWLKLYGQSDKNRPE